MWAPASAAMLTEIDIFRSANALIHEHGEDASLEACPYQKLCPPQKTSDFCVTARSERFLYAHG